MDSESFNSPPGQFLKSSTETIAQLIRWIAELIRQRNWYMLLVLLGVGLALMAHFGRDKFNQVIKEDFQAIFSILLWGMVGLIFLLALGIAVNTLPRSQSSKLEDLSERKAIKGLRPFGIADAEIFAQLQRERLLRTCVEVLTSFEFQFGILVGESGCGKTSFLQAGILPQFLRPECDCCGVYVRFSDQEPLAAIRQALAEQLEIPMEWLTTETEKHPFFALLTQAVTAADKPVVLFLDQFEQWYVHAKQPEDRQSFLQGLVAWYKQPQTPPVKILISIRSDLYFHIVEIQKALNFDLGPQDVFQLAKFTPTEAAQVLAVIAQTEKLRFEEPFVRELAEQELADQEDGLISPVDVQILAWMIERQNASELRAFNRQAFQKFGGVEGLLTRFLDQALMVRVSEKQRQAALKVLLALTDLEQQVRAGVLTISELQQKLAGSLSHQEVREAVRWLERGDVRLITPINQQQEEVGYELAHERIIPSLLKQAGQELSVADQANRLLDRRVNEWLGNNRSSRYFFGLRELWLFQKQKAYIAWGAKQRQKEKLLTLSRRRVYRFVGLLITFLLAIFAFWGWLRFTPEGQIQQVRWALINPIGGPLERIKDEDAASVAVAFAKDGKHKQALDIVTQYVDHPEEKAKFFSQFATALTHEINFKPAQGTLSLAKAKVEEIDDPSSKSQALQSIARAYGQLKEPKLAKEGLKDALLVTENIDDLHAKVLALSAIAETYEELAETKIATGVLTNALQVAEKIDPPPSKVEALRSIADAYGAIAESTLAKEGLTEVLQVAEKIDILPFKSGALQAIAEASGKLTEPQFAKAGLTKVLQVAEKIDDSRDQANALIEIAEAYRAISEPVLAKKGLTEVLQVAEKINEPNSNPKVDALRAIAGAYGKLSEPKISIEILKNALQVTEKIDNSEVKSDALQAIAEAHGKLSEPKVSTEILKNALQIAEEIDIPKFKSDALSAIAGAYGKRSDSQLAQAILKNALQVTEKIDDPISKSDALSAIAGVYGKLSDSQVTQAGLMEVFKVAEKIDDPKFKSDALSAIAGAYGQLSKPTLAKKVLENALQVTDNIDNKNSSAKSDALKTIAGVYKKFTEPQLALEGLKDVSKVAKKINDSGDKFGAMSAIIGAYGQLPEPQLVQAGLKDALKISEEANSENILAGISGRYAYINDWKHAFRALRYCPELVKVKALAEILTRWAEHKNPRLIDGAVILKQPKFSENKGKYTFSVDLYGPTKSCKQYIDWWEILNEDQELIARKTFNKSYGDQQPFTDKSSLIQVSKDQTLLIRAHLHLQYTQYTRGYEAGYDARQAWKGSINDGFKMIRLPEKFATDLAKIGPQPQPCT